MGIAFRKRLRKNPKASEDSPFCQLPDDIIITHILPRLSLQEAARLSIVSHRLQKLWIQNIPPNLIFSYKPGCFFKVALSLFKRFLTDGISHLLNTYDKPTLNELTIRFDFDSSDSETVDKWLDIGFRKKVMKIELDFSHWHYRTDRKSYTFPGVGRLSLLPNICHLRDLCLKSSNVSSDDIHLILSSCLSLDRLSLLKSKISGELRIDNGQGAKLKSLEFYHCIHKVHNGINISAENLVSLHYFGWDVRLKHVPSLSELSIGREYLFTFFGEARLKLSCFSQLKTLELDVPEERSLKFTSDLLDFPKLMWLEQLKLKVIAKERDLFLLWTILLIKAAPILHKFSFTACVWGGCEWPRKGTELEYENNVREAIKDVVHSQLKLFEICDYTSSQCELELSKHVIDSSQSLERVVLRRFHVHSRELYAKSVDNFRKLLSPGVKLVAFY